MHFLLCLRCLPDASRQPKQDADPTAFRPCGSHLNLLEAGLNAAATSFCVYQH